MEEVQDAQIGVKPETAYEINEKMNLLVIDAVYANKFYIATGKDGMVRIIFGDQKDESMPTKMRAEVILSFAGLMTLGNVMSQAVHNIENSQKQPVAPSQPEKEKID